VLDLDAWIRCGLLEYPGGSICWTSTVSGNENSLLYVLKPTDVRDCLYLYVFRTDANGKEICEPVTLLSKPQHFGGARWYFFCPSWCRRWVRKLYLPPGIAYLGCRTCHDLSYRSSQEHDKTLDIFRKNPAALDVGLKLGAFSAAQFVLKNLMRQKLLSAVEIRGVGNSDSRMPARSEY